MIIKQKVIIKIQQTNFRFFLESNFVEVNRLFVLFYTNQDAASKRFKAKRYYLPKGIIDNYSVIINGKSFCDQPIDFDIKRYEEIRKINNSTRRRLYYWMFIRLDLSRQKELDADPKVILQIEFVGKLKKTR